MSLPCDDKKYLRGYISRDKSSIIGNILPVVREASCEMLFR